MMKTVYAIHGLVGTEEVAMMFTSEQDRDRAREIAEHYYGKTSDYEYELFESLAEFYEHNGEMVECVLASKQRIDRRNAVIAKLSEEDREVLGLSLPTKAD